MIDLAYGVRAYNTPGGGTTLRALEGLGGGALIGSGNALDINDDKQPTTYSWSTTVNQKLPWSMMLEVGYVGNKSTDLMNFDLANYNAVPLGAMLNDPEGDANRYRPFPTYGSFNVFRHSIYQNYHGGQLLVTRQRGQLGIHRRLHVLEDAGRAVGRSGRLADGLGIHPRSRAGSTTACSARIARTWPRSPTTISSATSDRAAMNAVLGNWQVSGITQFISGAPIVGNFDIQGTLADGTPINATRITGSPDVRVQPAVTCDPRDDIPDGFLFNPACFAAPSVGQNGAYVFPTIRTQSYLNHDLSIAKNIPIGGNGQRLQVRVAAYNVFNHPLRVPDTSRNLTLRFENGRQTNVDFGRLPEDNKVGRRIVQIALRYSF